MDVQIEGNDVTVAECPAHRVRHLADVVKALRSKDVANPAEIFAGVHVDDEAGNAALTVRELIGGTLPFTDGATHRARRKLLNQLVRPDSLDSIREDIILPAGEELLTKLAEGPDERGNHRIDLVEYCERVFLNFSAQLIGLVGVDTDEGMARLRECVFPLFAGVSSGFLDERSAVNEAAMKAKQIYVEEFYRPSVEAFAEKLAKVERDEMAEEELPRCLIRYILTGADPAYLNDEQAILESIIFFVTSVGTSTQSIVWTVDDLHHWFADHPNERHRTSDVEFLVRALEEALRIRPSSVPFLTRLTERDLELTDETLEPGRELHVLLLDANRDPKVFGSDADEFNPLRPAPNGLPGYGLAFGGGSHQCFGLRVVLGNDGSGGAHVHLLRRLFEVGVEPDLERKPTVLERNVARVDGDGETTFPMTKLVEYPAILTQLAPC